jgi:anti-sigma-K factor RskA
MPSDTSNQPIQCDDVQPWLAAYALGEADSDVSMQAHLDVCPACQRDLYEYRRAARVLPYSAPEVAPSPALRERVIASVAAEASATPPTAEHPAARGAPAPAIPRRPLLRRPSGLWAAAAGAVAIVMALLGWNLALQRQISDQKAQLALSRQSWQTMIALLNDSSLRWYAVAGAKAQGHVWAVPQGKVACLVVQGLPELADDRVYQAWLVRGTERANGGVFEAHNGNAWILIQAGEPLADYQVMVVTIEPRGGADAPGGPEVLSGSLASAMLPDSSHLQELGWLLAQVGH